jgi:ABC-type branched-subunit amino acid transport system substrate-binding protein
MDDYKDDIWNPRRYFRGLLTDENEEDAPSAFRSYLGVLASPPRNFTEFSRRVNWWMEEEPFRFQNPLSRLGGLKNIRIEAAYLYDAVMLYAQAVRQIVEEPGNLSESEILEKILDGRGLSRRLRNIRYQSATGHETKMDENGDAEGNFTLIALKTRQGGLGLYPVGLFSRSSSQLPVCVSRGC